MMYTCYKEGCHARKVEQTHGCWSGLQHRLQFGLATYLGAKEGHGIS